MPIIAKDAPKTIHLPPPQTYQAVCFDVWDLGNQLIPAQSGTPEKIQHKAIIAWELDERIQSEDEMNGKRYHQIRKYTLSLNDKSNLAKDLTGWRGRPFTPEEKKGFDIEALIGVNCLLGIIHKPGADGKVYANIASISGLSKNMTKIAPESPRGMPEWVKKLVEAGKIATAAAPEEADAPTLDQDGEPIAF